MSLTLPPAETIKEPSYEVSPKEDQTNSQKGQDSLSHASFSEGTG